MIPIAMTMMLPSILAPLATTATQTLTTMRMTATAFALAHLCVPTKPLMIGALNQDGVFGMMAVLTHEKAVKIPNMQVVVHIVFV